MQLLNIPKPIDDNNWKNISKRFEANINNSNLEAASNELFNGNINLMITTIMPPVWSNTDQSHLVKAIWSNADQSLMVVCW